MIVIEFLYSLFQFIFIRLPAMFRQIQSKQQIVRIYTKLKQTCVIETDLLQSYFTLSLPDFRRFAGRFGDQGSMSFRKPRSVSSRCFGISVSRYSKLSLFAFAVFAMLQMIPPNFALATVSIMTQFFFPIQNPRIDCSAALLSIGTSPSSRNTFRYFS